MVYRTSKSVAASMALLAGCFGLLLPVANAGDKIEFSEPSVLLEVPQPERDVKQDAAAAIRSTFSTHRARGDVPTYAPMSTIIVPAQKSRDRFGWTAPFENDPEQDSHSGLDLFATKKVSVQTKGESISNDKDSGFSKDESWTRSDTGPTRFGTDTMQKDGESDEDQLSGRFDNHGVSDWLRTFNAHGRTALERTHMRAFVQGKEDVSTFSQQPVGGFSQPNPLGPADPLHSSAYASGNSGNDDSGNDFPIESLRGQNEQQVQMQPSVPHAWETLPSAAHPQRPLVREQAFSAPSRAPSAPAVLAFPKRPGALFQ